MARSEDYASKRVLYVVYVNGNPVQPAYNGSAEAIKNAEKRAEKSRLVTVARERPGRPPQIIAKWEDGDRQ